MRDTHKIELTPKQEAWMRKHFCHTKNDDICARFGWSASTMHRFARRLGLKKTRQFMKKCQETTWKAAWESNHRNGTFPPKGFIIPRSEEFRFKPGHKESEAKKRKRLAKSVATRRQTIKEERARANWGFPQLTKLRVIRQPQLAVTIRHYLRKHGYIIPRGSMVVYYDENTDRCPNIEARRMGDKHYIAFTFKPLNP